MEQNVREFLERLSRYEGRLEVIQAGNWGLRGVAEALWHDQMMQDAASEYIPLDRQRICDLIAAARALSWSVDEAVDRLWSEACRLLDGPAPARETPPDGNNDNGWTPEDKAAFSAAVEAINANVQAYDARAKKRRRQAVK